jgi:riboflavin synthase
MFTGIVEELGRVLATTPAGPGGRAGLRLRIAAEVVLDGSALGASIAVNGCCLTLVDRGEDAGGAWWATDLSAETLARTNLGNVVPGDIVNLERPLALGERLGGHLVLGHVDTIGEIVEPAPDLVVRIAPEHLRYLVEKGSVAVDGVSLTCFDLTTDTFSVAVIPHTAEVTTLGRRRAGDIVNIELDMLAKHIERLLAPHLDAPAPRLPVAPPS